MYVIFYVTVPQKKWGIHVSCLVSLPTENNRKNQNTEHSFGMIKISSRNLPVQCSTLKKKKVQQHCTKSDIT
jgi:hypothetical protein